MKPARRSALAVIALLLGTALAAPADSPVRILPLGDSITQSDAEHLSYRYVLWKRLIDAGKPIDFIGSMSPAPNERPKAWVDYQGHAFDTDHEGHSGWTAGNLLEGCPWAADKGKLSEWLKSYKPDIVLMHIGTNDVFHGLAADLTVEKIGGLIDVLRSANPKVTVFLAKIIPLAGQWADEYNKNILVLNGRMDGIAAAKSTNESKVIVVDQYSGFDGETDLFDSIHPNDSGAKKMGQRWADAILFDGTPIARDDRYETIQERPLRIETLAGVLANDYASGAPLSAVLTAPTAHGKLALQPSGEFEYTPETGFTGDDRFSYRAECGEKLSADRAVVLTVISNAPVAKEDLYGTAQDIPLSVDAKAGALTNDITYQGPLRAALSTKPRHGRVVLGADGSIEYTPEPAFLGDDEFQYTVTDGQKDGAPATIRVRTGHKAPVAWWKLDEREGLTAADASGGKHAGTLTHMDASGWISDDSGRSIQFDGQDDCVTIPPLDLNTNLMSLTAWIKRGGAQPIFTTFMFCAEGDTMAGIGMGSDPGWASNHELNYFWNGLYWNWHSELMVPDNEWCLVAMVITPNQGKLYLGRKDAVDSAINPKEHSPEEFNGESTIGGNGKTEKRFFKGRIRDVRLYDRPLTEEEVRRLAKGTE